MQIPCTSNPVFSDITCDSAWHSIRPTAMEASTVRLLLVTEPRSSLSTALEPQCVGAALAGPAPAHPPSMPAPGKQHLSVQWRPYSNATCPSSPHEQCPAALRSAECRPRTQQTPELLGPQGKKLSTIAELRSSSTFSVPAVCRGAAEPRASHTPAPSQDGTLDIPSATLQEEASSPARTPAIFSSPGHTPERPTACALWRAVEPAGEGAGTVAGVDSTPETLRRSGSATSVLSAGAGLLLLGTATEELVDNADAAASFTTPPELSRTQHGRNGTSSVDCTSSKAPHESHPSCHKRDQGLATHDRSCVGTDERGQCGRPWWHMREDQHADARARPDMPPSGSVELQQGARSVPVTDQVHVVLRVDPQHNTVVVWIHAALVGTELEALEDIDRSLPLTLVTKTDAHRNGNNVPENGHEVVESSATRSDEDKDRQCYREAGAPLERDSTKLRALHCEQAPQSEVGALTIEKVQSISSMVNDGHRSGAPAGTGEQPVDLPGDRGIPGNSLQRGDHGGTFQAAAARPLQGRKCGAGTPGVSHRAQASPPGTLGGPDLRRRIEVACHPHEPILHDIRQTDGSWQLSVGPGSAVLLDQELSLQDDAFCVEQHLVPSLHVSALPPGTMLLGLTCLGPCHSTCVAGTTVEGQNNREDGAAESLGLFLYPKPHAAVLSQFYTDNAWMQVRCDLPAALRLSACIQGHLLCAVWAHSMSISYRYFSVCPFLLRHAMYRVHLHVLALLSWCRSVC
jgi:hypothetical protein